MFLLEKSMLDPWAKRTPKTVKTKLEALLNELPVDPKVISSSPQKANTDKVVVLISPQKPKADKNKQLLWKPPPPRAGKATKA